MELSKYIGIMKIIAWYFTRHETQELGDASNLEIVGPPKSIFKQQIAWPKKHVLKRQNKSSRNYD